jgi:predicted metal-dependent HD superfamily phosphohydrolase
MLGRPIDWLSGGRVVRATAHLAGAVPRGPAAELVVDIDLAILGKDALRFLEYEHGLAEEHARLGSTRFILGRGRFLAGMLASPSIYRTARFRAEREPAARANLTALLRSPRYRVYRWMERLVRLVTRRHRPGR